MENLQLETLRAGRGKTNMTIIHKQKTQKEANLAKKKLPAPTPKAAKRKSQAQEQIGKSTCLFAGSSPCCYNGSLDQKQNRERVVSTEQRNVIEKCWRWGAFGGFKEEWGLDFEERDNNPTKEKWRGSLWRKSARKVPFFVLSPLLWLGVDTSVSVGKQ